MQYLTQPLHPAQWEVFTDQLLNLESPHYNVGGYIKLEGDLNIEQFREAVRGGPKIFDVFKMRFDINLSEPRCYLAEDFEKMEIGDLDLTGEINPAEKARLWMKTEFNTPFVIEKEQLLFKQVLIKISSNEHWYFAKYHHLIIDGYGFIVWTQYLAQKYQSLINGNHLQSNYPAYATEALRAVEYTKSQEYESDATYWKEKFSDRPEKILQKKYVVDNNSVKNSSTHIVSLLDEERELLEGIQVTTKAGLQQLTIAALLIYFGKALNKTAFTFGIPLHKRGSRQLRNTMGMFAGLLPYRGNFQNEFKLLDFIKEISQNQKKDYRHQHYLIGDISRHLKLNSSEGYLFEISINYELFNFAVNFGDGIHAKIFHLPTEHEPIPLQLCWQDYGPQQPLQLHLHFRHDYFSEDEIGLFAQRILYILKQFPEALNNNLGSIDILPLPEKKLISEFNNTDAGYSHNKSIVELFYDQVKQNPDQIALIYEQEQLTFNELNKRSNQLAHHLRSKGVKEEILVPICVERSFELIIGILGILKSGGAYVPIDPSYPAERIEYMLKDCKSNVVVSNSRSKLMLPLQKNIEIIELDTNRLDLEKESVENLQITIKEDQLAYVIYTSGSTGKPKGVMIEHRNLLNYLLNTKTKYVRDDEVGSGTFLHLSYTFDASLTGIFMPLLFGKSIVISSREGLDVFTDSNFLKFAPYDFIKLTPSHLALLEAAVIDFNGKAVTQRLVVGGEALHLSHCEYLISGGMDVEIINEYGPTEATVGCSTYSFRSSGDTENLRHGISIGKPIDHAQIHILNDQHEVLPIGIPGEIYIGGNGLARGYLNLDDLTTEKFISNRIDEKRGPRLYKTGDLGRWGSDGNIEYLGRLDDQVKIRGYRIELGEIETLLEQSENVRQAVVVARTDKSKNKQMVAYILPQGSFNSELIKKYLKERLPDYMIPGLLVEMKEFPLTANGKIDKMALPDADFNNVPGNIYAPPRNELEFALTEIWKEILDVKKVGINDNFFELGGHSLKAMQLISRLHKQLNLKTNIAKILSNPTISELANVLRSDLPDAYSEIPKLRDQEYYELSHTQKRIWVVNYFKDGSTMYNVPGAYLISGDLEVTAFKKALNMVIDRHEILRTIFIQVDNQPMQKILSLNELKFEVQEVDLRNRESSEESIEKWLEDDFRKAFDLEKGPLLRATLFYTKHARYILGFNIHHIISDGWSKDILIKELLHCYQNIVTGTEINLPSLSIQYRDYAAWHAKSYKAQKDYWLQLYKKDVPVLNFPVDFERPRILSFDGAILQLQVPETLTRSLQKMAVEQGTTLNNLMFALYGILLAKHSGQNDVVVGSLVSGRNHADLENLVGLFINFLPIRLEPKSELSLKEYLQNSYRSLAEGYSNQDYPFDLMVDDILKKRDFSRNPFFDTMVNFHSENKIDQKIDLPSDRGLELVPLDVLKKDFFQSVLDFKLDVEFRQSSLVLNMSYNAGLFSKERMERFLAEYTDLLLMAVKDQEFHLVDILKFPGEKDDRETNHFTDSALLSAMLPVNICSSFVSEPLQEYIEYWSNELEINTNLTFAPYNQVFQQLLDPDSLLRKNHGINVLFVRMEDWLRDHRNKSAQEQIDIVRETFYEFLQSFEQAQKNSVIPFLVGIVPLHPSPSFSAQVVDYINELIHKLELALKKLSRVYLLDLTNIASLYQVDEIFDTKSDELGHIPFTQEYYAALGTYIMRKIRAYKGPSYKVIVLDCDNTLWKGVCGELGPLNVTVDENFSYLQDFLLQKYNEGFLLALCSKNNEDDVWEVFDRHPDMKIKREHIAAFQINWNSKATNLAAIANELNLGLNSIIFIDDSEFEVEQVSLGCPDVLSLVLPEDSHGSFAEFLNHIWAMDHLQLTEEDMKRNTMYKAEKQRKEELVKHTSLDNFLTSLKIKVEVLTLEEKDLERAVQLTLRTNQFNLNGVRKSPEEIIEYIRQPNTLNWIIDVKDRFGDYGIAGLLLARKSQNSLVLDTFLLSCRVLGRNVEELILTELRNYCIVHQLDNILALYQPTAKNKPMMDFLLGTHWEENLHTKAYHLMIQTPESKLFTT